MSKIYCNTSTQIHANVRKEGRGKGERKEEREGGRREGREGEGREEERSVAGEFKLAGKMPDLEL